MLEKTEESAGFEAEWRARFDRFAARGGSEAHVSGWSEHGLRRRLEVVSRAVTTWPPKAGLPVLDLGCGTGVYGLRLRELGLAVVGADYSLGMLRRAREVVGGAVPLTAGDVLRQPFADAAFGGAICVGVLQHVARGREAVAEMARVLAPGGTAAIVTLNRISMHSFLSWGLATAKALAKGRLLAKRHAVRRSASTMIDLGRSAGLEPVAVRGVYLFPRGLGWVEKLLEKLEWLRWPWNGRPVLLPLANAMLVVLRK